MNKCLICEANLNLSNQSEEHIIPNSLGGTLTSTALICRSCNSRFGSDCDAKLAEDLKLFANFLNIKRDRGVAPTLKAKAPSSEYLIRPGGKPEIVKPIIEIDHSKKGDIIHIEARDMNQARQILEGMKRKYPEIDVDKALSEAEHRREYLDEFVKLNFVFRGRDSLRAIVKMAFFYLKYKRPELSFDKAHIVSFLKHESDFREVCLFFPDLEIVVNPHKTVCHSIIVKSYPSEKTLVAFVELYNVLSFVVELSHNFIGDIEETYTYDILNRTELSDVQINLPVISQESLNELFHDPPAFYDTVSKRFESFLRIVLDSQHESHRQELVQRAIRNSLLKHPEGTLVDEKMINELVDKLMDEITPLLIRNLKEPDE
ncbi:MAG: HNH endonuclease [Candidatus Zixiibacteriota bacterium]